MPSRRQLLIFGSAGLGLVGSGAVWRVTRVPETATRPWRPEVPVADVRLDALRHAILAPNPHNRQPWLLTLVDDDIVDVRCDLDRRLPATDPFDRQILIGFGAFCELACIAASKRGHRVEITAFPEGVPGARLDARVVARLRFIADPAMRPDPLASVIFTRRTTRQPFEPRPVPSATLARFDTIAMPGVAISHTNLPDRLARIRGITVPAFRIEALTPRTWRESVDLMRIGADEIDANPDGLSLSGPGIETLALLGVLNRSALADQDSLAFRQGLAEQVQVLDSLPSAMWLTTPDNSRESQLAAGRTWLRVNLLATALGLKLHPNSQALQEFPEMAARFTELHRELGCAGGERVQMFGRIGYGPVVPPSPRWPIERHLRT